MTQHKTLYPQNFIVRCDNCGNHSRLPVTITTENVPCHIACNKCGAHKLCTKQTKFPKITPLPNLDQAIISYPPASDSPEELEREHLHAIESVNVDDPVSFYFYAERLGELTKQMFADLGSLNQHLKAFEVQVAEHFESLHKESSSFRFYWKPQHLFEFLKQPFLSLPILCEDELASKYAYWLVSPKFYDTSVGLPIKASGGFRLRLINQYLRMMEPLDKEFCSSLGWPETLDLEVKGRKIIGSSLPFCWKDIPGLLEDHDSTEEWVSVYMSRPLLARQWLAQHGVVPWEAKPIRAEELHVRKIDETMFTRFSFGKAWTQYMQCGRLGIFWTDSIEARRFATLVAMTSKGITPVFVEDFKQKMMWNGLYTEMFADANRGPTKNTEMIFFENGSPLVWDTAKNCKLIIVDLYGDIDTEILEKLMAYEGHLLLIGYDPLMDFQTSNVQASLVHALCGFININRDDMEAAWWPGSNLETKMPKLAAALKGMQLSGK